MELNFEATEIYNDCKPLFSLKHKDVFVGNKVLTDKEIESAMEKLWDNQKTA